MPMRMPPRLQMPRRRELVLATRVMVTGRGTTRGDWDGNRVVNPVNTSNTTANERGKTKDRFLVLHPLDYSCFGATLDYDIYGKSPD